MKKTFVKPQARQIALQSSQLIMSSTVQTPIANGNGVEAGAKGTADFNWD